MHDGCVHEKGENDRDRIAHKIAERDDQDFDTKQPRKHLVALVQPTIQATDMYLVSLAQSNSVSVWVGRIVHGLDGTVLGCLRLRVFFS